MKPETKEHIKEIMSNELPPRRILIEIITDLARLLTGTLTGNVDHEDKDTQREVLEVINKAISIMSLVDGSEAIMAMLHEEDRQHFDKLMTGMSEEQIKEVLEQYRKEEGDEAANAIEKSFYNRRTPN
tara:strand:+ start:10188 stop:10571 length:384 start_codon:yes stop_codon:yes gene_type:complete